MKKWLMWNFPKQTALGHFSGGRGPSYVEWLGRVARHTQVSLHKDKEAVCGYLLYVFNRWVDSATQLEFLKIKGLQLVVSEGLCHGKREWRIPIGNIPILSAGPFWQSIWWQPSWRDLSFMGHLSSKWPMGKHGNQCIWGLTQQSWWVWEWLGKGSWQGCATKLLVQLPFLILNQTTTLSLSL